MLAVTSSILSKRVTPFTDIGNPALEFLKVDFFKFKIMGNFIEISFNIKLLPYFNIL
jgi:hypothetical protein